jgi:hypothetical protein
MRHAVAVFVDLDVIVDVNRHRLEACQFIGLCGQRLQCRCVQVGGCARATSGQLRGSYCGARVTIVTRPSGLFFIQPIWVAFLQVA